MKTDNILQKYLFVAVLSINTKFNGILVYIQLLSKLKKNPSFYKIKLNTIKIIIIQFYFYF